MLRYIMTMDRLKRRQNKPEKKALYYTYYAIFVFFQFCWHNPTQILGALATRATQSDSGTHIEYRLSEVW